MVKKEAKSVRLEAFVRYNEVLAIIARLKKGGK